MKRKLLFLMALFVSSTMAWAESGTCGDGVTWDLTDGTLTISYTGSGTGAMHDYAAVNEVPDMPWASSRTTITSVVVGEGVTHIGNLAFYGHTNLESITYPTSCTTIGDNVFYGCTSLQSFTVKNTVTSIGIQTFKGCTVLNSVTFESGCQLTEISSELFKGCTSLTSIEIPSSVTTLGVSPFAYTGLESITVAAGNEKYDSRNSCNAVIEKSSNTLVVGCKNTTIPSSVTTIGENAFIGCTFSSFNIPETVIAIGEGAFYDCTSLNNVTIPSGVTIINPSTFNGCSSLNNITFNGDITQIGGYAFNGCAFTSFNIPATVTSVGLFNNGELSAFGCPNLEEITINYPTAAYDMFAFIGIDMNTVFPFPLDNLTAINVPGVLLDEYASSGEVVTGMLVEGYNYCLTSLKATWQGNSANGSYWSTYYNNACNVTVDANTQIYYISTIDGTNATLTENTTDKVITKGKAVVLKSTAENVTLRYSAAASGCAYTGNQLAGVDVATTIVGSAYENKYIYTLANESGLGFYKYTGSTLGANKAFLPLDAEVAAGARGFVFEFEETTGVNEELRMKNEEFAPAVYYNLKGQRVEKPAKGLYIKNGKKYIVE
ncbi:MAG: leucine-rich repeat domain-containing protein [Bacteroidaceae bacterium]|nr:leucine-rich repeat domain-containing protein [Bacteroidaceae bacterium]